MDAMMCMTLDAEGCWEAVKRRDAAYDGKFYYAVTTTGVYCRPNCAARLASRANVRFFRRPEEAEAAGFRPCKRCKPNEISVLEKQQQAVVKACRLIEAAETAPSLSELAAEAGMSAFHFHRLFKKVTGVTPKAYADAHRDSRMKRELEAGETVTSAIYSAGYSSSSRFYEKAKETLGMTASAYRKGGAGMQIRYAIAPCPLGFVLAAATARGICTIQFGDDETGLVMALRRRFSSADIHPSSELGEWMEVILRHLESPDRRLDLPLDIRGTAFQRQVWQALREIPPGSTASYTEIAACLGRPKGARAVAQACASNPLAMAIPCHRVVRSNGDLSGYRWGIERKRWLIEHERAGAVAASKRVDTA